MEFEQGVLELLEEAWALRAWEEALLLALALSMVLEMDLELELELELAMDMSLDLETTQCLSLTLEKDLDLDLNIHHPETPTPNSIPPPRNPSIDNANTGRGLLAAGAHQVNGYLPQGPHGQKRTPSRRRHRRRRFSSCPLSSCFSATRANPLRSVAKPVYTYDELAKQQTIAES